MCYPLDFKSTIINSENRVKFCGQNSTKTVGTKPAQILASLVCRKVVDWYFEPLIHRTRLNGFYLFTFQVGFGLRRDLCAL